MVRSKEIAFRAGEEELGGTLVLPDTADRAPWVLLVSSWLARDRDGAWDRAGHPGWFVSDVGQQAPLLSRLADALATLGVASFRYDKRGCGASGGAWETASLFTLIDDARDAIGAMRSRPELDLRRTGILAHGEGATVALSVAIGDPALGALTLVGASARGLRDVMRRGAATRSRTGADRGHPLVTALDGSLEELLERAERREPTMALQLDAERIELGLAGWEQAIHTPPRALATMLHRSVTLVHGADDAWAHPDEAGVLAAVLEAGGNAPKLQVEPGAGHDLAELDDPRIRAIAADLAARLEPRELPPVLLAIEDAGSG
jgi:alpha-beta hydrolase superfamily lysophospholipase